MVASSVGLPLTPAPLPQRGEGFVLFFLFLGGTANEASCSERERCEERDRSGAAEVELAFSIGAAERDSVVQASRNLSFPEVLVSADVFFGFGTGVEE